MPRRAANAKKDTSTPQKRRISGWRKWLFRALAATIGPAICLLGLEFGLQLFGYGHSPDFFMKLESGDAYTTNPRFGYRFFPSSMAREPAPCRLPARKADNTYRIIILGGSAARGTPDWTLGFGRFLQAMLQQARPDMKFEVVNAAMTAINSHVVLPIARDAAEHDPDLFVVYMGNNEVVGPYGTAAMFGDFSPNLTLIRTGIYVNSTRTGQLIKSLFASAGADKTQWDGMQMFLDRQVAASDPKLQDAYKHFRSNLNEICNVAQDAETPMILCTVATNLKDSAPFASMHRDGMTEAQLKQWSDLVRSAQTSADDGDHDQAVETYRKAAELDDRHAELHFRMAHSLLAANRTEEAKGHFITARDLDSLRFRADTSVNETIRQVAAERTDSGVYLLDAEREFEHAAGGIPGDKLFYEHVHLTPEGNYLLARTVFTQISQILPKSTGKGSSPPAGAATLEQCLAAIPLTIWDRYRMRRDINGLLSTPPFTNRWRHKASIAEQLTELKRIAEQCQTPEATQTARRAYESALTKSPNSIEIRANYAMFLAESGNYTLSAQQWRKLLAKQPHVARWRMLLGQTLAKTGDSAEAILQLRKAMLTSPSLTAKSLTEIGETLLRGNKPVEAETEFRRVTAIAGARAAPHERLGVALMMQAKFAEAIECFERALKIDPKLATVHNNLGAALDSSGDLPKAIEHYRKAIELDPSYKKTYPNIARALSRQGLALLKNGKLKEAGLRFGEIYQTDPSNVDAGCKYAAILRDTGQAVEGVRIYRKVMKHSPDYLPAINDLARMLAASPDPRARDGAEALRIIKTCPAVERSPILLDTLAAAYAEAGQFDLAVSTATRAIKLATSLRQDRLIPPIRSRLELYRQEKPYRQADPANKNTAP